MNLSSFWHMSSQFTCICRPADKYVYQHQPFGQTADVCLRVSVQMWSKCNKWKWPMRCPFQGQLLIGNCQLVDMLHQYHQLWGTTKCFLLKISSKVVCPSLSSSTSEVNPPDPSVKCHWRCHPTPPLSTCKHCVWPVRLAQPSPGLEFSPHLRLEARL